MRQRLGLSIAVLLSASVSIAKADVLLVNNSHDFGAGSFRQALAQAEVNPDITLIRFEHDYMIKLHSALMYRGSQALTIDGGGAVLNGEAVEHDNILNINSAAPITLKQLNVRNSPASGIVVTVPHDATGTVAVVLEGVVIEQAALYGLHIDDNFHAEDEGDVGSAAGIELTISASSFVDNGLGALDYDGIRVDERGDGSIRATIADTQISRNGGDGLELDEGGAGDVTLAMNDVHLDGNGFFNQADLDDGLDIDEAGAGDVNVMLVNVTTNANYEQGIDLDEIGSGSIDLAFVNVQANDNANEGIRVDEDFDGDIVTRFSRVQVNKAGQDGVQIAQQGKGQVLSVVESADRTVSDDILRLGLPNWSLATRE